MTHAPLLRSVRSRRGPFVVAALATAMTVTACRHDVRPAPPDVSASPHYGVVRVDSTRKLQVMHGWEATVQAGEGFPEFPSYKEHLFDLAVDSVGLNRLRVHARSGSENRRDWYTDIAAGNRDEHKEWRCVRFSTVNDNADPHVLDRTGFHFSEIDHQMEAIVLPIKQRLERRGEHLFINVIYSAFTSQICGDLKYEHDDPEEYAEFVLATFLHMRERWGIVPDAWEVILEPDNSKQWTKEHVRASIVAAARRLREAGFTPRFIAPSNAHMGNAVEYMDWIVKDTAATGPLVEIAYHRYGIKTRASLEALAAHARRLGISTAMLEHIGSGYEDLHDDIEIGYAGAWQQFALAWPVMEKKQLDKGGTYITIDRTDSTNVKIAIGKRSRLLAMYFRNVRLGAQRIGATSGVDDVRPLAFRDSTGAQVVVSRTERASRFSVTGLPPARYVVSWRGENDDAGSYPAVELGRGQSLNVTMPVRGVVVVAPSSGAR